MDTLGDALVAAVTDALPTVGVIFASIIGLVFLFAVGAFILRRIRGAVK